MKSIKLSDEELELLREHYQMILVEAEKEIENIKSILNKLGSSKAKKTTETMDIPERKRGRKSRVVKEKVETREKKKVRKPRSDKGSQRKSVKPEAKSLKPISKPAKPQIEKAPTPKKKVKRKRNNKPRSVILKPLSKPLKNKPVVETPTTPEVAK